MKALVLYYSRTGTTERVAKDIQQRLGCDIEPIVSKTSYRYVTGWLKAGREGMKQVLPELEPLRSDLGGYDVVIVGTPIWAGDVASPVRALLAKDGGRIGRCAVFITSGGEDRAKSFGSLETLCGKPPVAKLGLATREVKKGMSSAKVDAFVEEVKRGSA